MTPQERYAQDYLLSKGWSATAAPAMVATLAGESGPSLNTNAYQKLPNGGLDWSHYGAPPSHLSEASSGLPNWNFPRASAFLNFSKTNNLDPNSADTQLNYIDREARSMGIPVTSNSPSAALASLFTSQYERPKVANGAQRWRDFVAGGIDSAGAGNAPPNVAGTSLPAWLPPAAAPPGSGDSPAAPPSGALPPNQSGSTIGGLLAGIANALTQHTTPPGAVPAASPPAPQINISDLLAGVHPHQVQATGLGAMQMFS